MAEILRLPDDAHAARDGARAADVLEGGGLVLFETLGFPLSPGEQAYADPAILAPRSKNVSLDPRTGALGGTVLEGAAREGLRVAVARYAAFADALVAGLLPGYARALERRRTSFRPGAVDERALSPRKDDKRLHLDAFPSSPVGGRRILRVFSNVDPEGRPRLWRLGDESLESHARTRLTRYPRLGVRARAMEALRITRGRRTDYDQAMLALHDGAKLDDVWQARAPRTEVELPAGSTWIVYTDGVLHAAMRGQHAFEQTYLMPVEAMARPERSPLRTLERLAGRPLV